jgi:hypothetical protein
MLLPNLVGVALEEITPTKTMFLALAVLLLGYTVAVAAVVNMETQVWFGFHTNNPKEDIDSIVYK